MSEQIDYASYTKAELLDIARDRNLEGRSNLDKEELVAALESDDAANEQADSLDLLTPSDQLADGDEPEGELEGPTVTAEDQENYEELDEASQDLVGEELATHGPLNIESPYGRILTGAVNEEQAKEQEKIYAQLPEGFTGDIPEKPSEEWLDSIQKYHRDILGQN